MPAKPYQPNFDKTLYARSYLSLFTDLNRLHHSPNINISFSDYKDGYTLYAIDLTPDLAANESHVSVNRSGNIGIDIKFGTALSETVSLVVYAEYRNVIEIDKSRGVYTDFWNLKRMEEVMQVYGENISELVRQYKSIKNVIEGIAQEMFSDKINVTRIAFFLAFAQKALEECPKEAETIYEDVFHSLYRNIKF